MLTIEVNNRKIEAKSGEMLLDTLKRNGITVPTLCHMENLFPTGACRMCVVEVEGERALVPSCAYPVRDGMKVQTHSPRALRARKTIIELLLANHPDDCLYCVRSGHCDLQGLANELGVRERRYSGGKNEYHVDSSNPSIVRDPAKCILCGKCVRVCEEVQAVAAIDFVGRGSKTMVGTAFSEGLNVSSCINCGQCIMVCPTGALREQSYIKEVLNAIADPGKLVVVQHAPSVSVTLGEEFGLKPGADVDGMLVAALRRLGFDRVFDTSFSADLTIMEEASELAHRIRTGGKLPMMTSCSPGWIKFVEEFYPEMLDNLSTCKSPQQMMGAVIKSFFAEREGIAPDKIFSVAIMPCVAKKFEAGRPEHSRNGIPDIDAVLTTRELARVIRMRGMDLQSLTPEHADTPFGERSTAGKIFGASGGVMEAAIRTAYHLLTGDELPGLKVEAIRGFDGRKEAKLEINGTPIGVAVVSGLQNARQLLEEIRNGRDDIHFIEVMTCPGGCIAGGGQPLNANPDAIRARMQALYTIDRDEPVRTSHGNPSIQRLYTEFLGEPLGEKSHHLLHTHYAKREVMV
ncbi:MAG TPA: NADH-dependent [FeFe] hydrogenase, group A6 [Candidatus Hydrogenedentes bacterium]|nr:[FeFe] hydrogenase, group A [Candidatus Hydrogenedentota bacterium]NLT60551.1 4Fe-4S binding protein [Candidatus Hydrogenedentota bacterium]HNV21201.1 NADH-dependent [FeFe] hydrogenase, group A6 [Candidatus Hydrogenedentota bacterium]HNZ19434.1 NADH-dependent [FeFe] hydrogenase, group A6 [Candidatus Hydrogenedentota bacterium]HPA03760.1 NADH-dependent [FeFe] hydrogenase, group A6 [Candidatus Hydrogenedentota bacterium]